jgi:hypothetical protein
VWRHKRPATSGEQEEQGSTAEQGTEAGVPERRRERQAKLTPA